MLVTSARNSFPIIALRFQFAHHGRSRVSYFCCCACQLDAVCSVAVEYIQTVEHNLMMEQALSQLLKLELAKYEPLCAAARWEEAAHVVNSLPFEIEG